jgi:glycosyltransferase involved in cell wall biosynthesis
MPGNYLNAFDDPSRKFFTKGSLPLVSVIIPTKKRLNLLHRAIESVFMQDYGSIELIIVDDSDTTEDSQLLISFLKEIRSKIANGLKVIEIVYIKNNGAGVSAARNTGLIKSKGVYICFLDSDDYFLFGKISTQVLYMLSKDSYFSHTNYISIEESSGRSQVIDTSYNSGLDKNKSLIRKCIIATPTVMLKRELAINLMPLFPEQLYIGEDVIAWWKIGNRQVSFDHIPKTYTIVRIHSEQNKNRNLELVRFWIFVEKLLLDGLKFESFTKKFSNALFYKIYCGIKVLYFKLHYKFE